MKNLNKKTLAAALLCGAGLLAAGTTQAASYDLHTGTANLTMPDNKVVPMWGFGLGLSPGAVTVPGPALVVPVGDNTLTITLQNYLNEPVSLVIPGLAPALPGMVARQPLASDPTRAQSFSVAAAPNGGSATYTWNNVQPGTYLYHSGSHPAVQVPMGLYGAVTKNHSATEAYPAIPVTSQVTLLFSEIDPAVHDAVGGVNGASYGPNGTMTSTIRSKAKYFLINGEAYDPADGWGANPIVAGAAGSTVLLRLLNAGNDYRVPVLLNSDLRLIAEDGNLYNYAKDSYAVELAPMKTIDALWVAPAAGTFALYDRHLGLSNAGQAGGGMLTYLQIQ